MDQNGTTEGAAPGGPDKVASLAASIIQGGGTDTERGGPLPGSAEAPASEYKPLSPSQVRSLVTLPAAIGHSLTGNDLWLLDPAEEKALTDQTTEALNVFLNLDPKKFLGISLAVTWFAVYGTRLLAQINENKKGEQKK